MRPKPRKDPRVILLLDALDEAFRGPSWHGPALRETLRGLTLAEALFRPAAERHSAWELLLHAAYWKNAVRGRITTGRMAPFPRVPRNFPAVPKRADASSLARDVALLEREHASLRAAVSALPPRRLSSRVGRFTVQTLVLGAASHDLYHAGQIRLLARLAEDALTAPRSSARRAPRVARPRSRRSPRKRPRRRSTSRGGGRP